MARLSRRLFVGALAAAGVVPATAVVARAEIPERSMSIAARVRWCNSRRAIVSVRADTQGASDRTVQLQRYRDDVDGGVLRKLLRPDTSVGLELSWHPELDPLAPWRVEAVVSDGRRLIAALGRSRATEDMQIVIAVSAAHFGVTEAEVLSQRRSRQVLRARQTAMYLAHAVAGYSLAEISHAFQRDYTPILHAIRKIEHEVDTDAVFASTVAEMRSRVHEIAGAAELAA